MQIGDYIYDLRINGGEGFVVDIRDNMVVYDTGTGLYDVSINRVQVDTFRSFVNHHWVLRLLYNLFDGILNFFTNILYAIFEKIDLF